jgi:Arc/MetJ family transcription regulator
MRTTVTLDDRLLEEASEATGVKGARSFSTMACAHYRA